MIFRVILVGLEHCGWPGMLRNGVSSDCTGFRGAAYRESLKDESCWSKINI